jgi:hypothetical protein
MTRKTVYVKHVTEEVVLNLGPNMSYWQWHQIHEIKRDPSVSDKDFYKETE